jgi:hypothetical protein
MQTMAEEGTALIDRHSPDVFLYVTPDTGNSHQLLRLAAYESGAARDRARATAAADPEVQALRGQLRRVVESVDETLLLPIPCSPLR